MTTPSQVTPLGNLLPVSSFDLDCWRAAGRAVAMVAGHGGQPEAVRRAMISKDSDSSRSPMTTAWIVFASAWAQDWRAGQACADSGHQACLVLSRECWAEQAILTDNAWLEHEREVLRASKEGLVAPGDDDVVLALAWQAIRRDDNDASRSQTQRSWSLELEHLLPAISDVARHVKERGSIRGSQVLLSLDLCA